MPIVMHATLIIALAALIIAMVIYGVRANFDN
jgi:hypothetical protein